MRKEGRSIRADFKEARASLALSVLKSEAQRLEFELAISLLAEVIADLEAEKIALHPERNRDE
jgi:CYTH domain-containing protein